MAARVGLKAGAAFERLAEPARHETAAAAEAVGVGDTGVIPALALELVCVLRPGHARGLDGLVAQEVAHLPLVAAVGARRPERNALLLVPVGNPVDAVACLAGSLDAVDVGTVETVGTLGDARASGDFHPVLFGQQDVGKRGDGIFPEVRVNEELHVLDALESLEEVALVEDAAGLSKSAVNTVGLTGLHRAVHRGGVAALIGLLHRALRLLGVGHAVLIAHTQELAGDTAGLIGVDRGAGRVSAVPAGHVHVAHDGVQGLQGMDDLHAVAGVLMGHGKVNGTVESAACRVIAMRIGMEGVADQLGLDAGRLLGCLRRPLRAVVVIMFEHRAQLDRVAALERNLRNVIRVKRRVGGIRAPVDDRHVVGVGQELVGDAGSLAVDHLSLGLFPLVGIPQGLFLKLVVGRLVLGSLHIPLGAGDVLRLECALALPQARGRIQVRETLVGGIPHDEAVRVSVALNIPRQHGGIDVALLEEGGGVGTLGRRRANEADDLVLLVGYARGLHFLAHKERAVGPALHIPVVVQLLVDGHLRPGKGDGAVGAGTGAEVVAVVAARGFLGEVRHAGIDVDVGVRTVCVVDSHTTGIVVVGDLNARSPLHPHVGLPDVLTEVHLVAAARSRAGDRRARTLANLTRGHRVGRVVQIRHGAHAAHGIDAAGTAEESECRSTVLCLNLVELGTRSLNGLFPRDALPAGVLSLGRRTLHRIRQAHRMVCGLQRGLALGAAVAHTTGIARVTLDLDCTAVLHGHKHAALELAATATCRPDYLGIAILFKREMNRFLGESLNGGHIAHRGSRAGKCRRLQEPSTAHAQTRHGVPPFPFPTSDTNCLHRAHPLRPAKSIVHKAGDVTTHGACGELGKNLSPSHRPCDIKALKTV